MTLLYAGGLRMTSNGRDIEEYGGSKTMTFFYEVLTMVLTLTS